MGKFPCIGWFFYVSFCYSSTCGGRKWGRASFGSFPFILQHSGFFCGSAWVVFKGSFSIRGAKAPKEREKLMLPQMEIWGENTSPIIKKSRSSCFKNFANPSTSRQYASNRACSFFEKCPLEEWCIFSTLTKVVKQLLLWGIRGADWRKKEFFIFKSRCGKVGCGTDQRNSFLSSDTGKKKSPLLYTRENAHIPVSGVAQRKFSN